MEQQEEATPFQTVKDCCRRLRQEWEAMMHSVDIASNQVLSSLKAQEAAFMEEKTLVYSLKEETNVLNRSFLQQTEEQEKKAFAERSLADQIKKTIHKQLGEVKQMQSQLASQLAQIRISMENIRKPKREEDNANSIVVPSTAADLLGLEIVLALEDQDPRIFVGSSDAINSHSNKPGVETDNNIFRVWESRDSASTPRQQFEQSYAKVKTEELSNEEYIQGNVLVESDVKPFDSIQRTCYKGPLVQKRSEVGISVKTEPEEVPSGALEIIPCNETATGANVVSEDYVDELDHIVLSKRLELLVQWTLDGHLTGKDYTAVAGDAEFSKKKKPSGQERRSLAGKRKWDVPIEVALQEDAPGLLEKLVERGLLDGMAIYGAFCEDEWENSKDHFKDLECIVSKLWGTPSGLFKQPQAIRQYAPGVSKATYCLSCLVSLIDQAKSLTQRNWPVEWGWCRELQAFIFVFDKHNRIVLERPEYGNATYFFELVQVLPVKWQVLRLIRVLSITALGRMALLENRPLEVGFDLTADESKKLEYYGWAAGTGLGSFLNFCDRVYHEGVYHEGQEEDNFEWRQKIGKCLMDGYDKGRIMTSMLPPRFLEGRGNIKFEEDIKPGTILLT